MNHAEFIQAIARDDIIDGRLELMGVDVYANRNGWAAIYEWSGDGRGNTKDALRLLRSFSTQGIEVCNPGPEGSPSRCYWDKMYREGFVDRLTDQYGSVIKAKRSLNSASTQNLAAWLGSSKVVDTAGSPMIVYHASCNEWEGHAFRRKKSKGGTMSMGYHFGTAQAAEERIQPAVDDVTTFSWMDLHPHTIAAYLRIENPLRLRDIGSWHDAAWIIKALKEAGIEVKSSTIASITKELKQLGYDGIVYTNRFEAIDSESWIAFDPKQIKSAIGNSGQFNRESDSLTDWDGLQEEEAEPLRERMRA